MIPALANDPSFCQWSQLLPMIPAVHFCFLYPLVTFAAFFSIKTNVITSLYWSKNYFHFYIYDSLESCSVLKKKICFLPVLVLEYFVLIFGWYFLWTCWTLCYFLFVLFNFYPFYLQSLYSKIFAAWKFLSLLSVAKNRTVLSCKGHFSQRLTLKKQTFSQKIAHFLFTNKKWKYFA